MLIIFNWKKFNNYELVIIESYNESLIKKMSQLSNGKNYSETFPNFFRARPDWLKLMRKCYLCVDFLIQR